MKKSITEPEASSLAVLLLKVVNYMTFFCVTFFLGTLFTLH